MAELTVPRVVKDGVITFADSGGTNTYEVAYEASDFGADTPGEVVTLFEDRNCITTTPTLRMDEAEETRAAGDWPAPGLAGSPPGAPHAPRLPARAAKASPRRMIRHRRPASVMAPSSLAWCAILVVSLRLASAVAGAARGGHAQGPRPAQPAAYAAKEPR